MSQITVGVQVGGQTFSEIVFFNDQKSLNEFKYRGKLGFSANASAVIIKAAATATSSPSGVEAKAYSQGGMLLELSLGGSNFLFVPPLKNSIRNEDASQNPEASQKDQEQNKQSEEGSKQNQERDQQSNEDSKQDQEHEKQTVEASNRNQERSVSDETNKGTDENQSSNGKTHTGVFGNIKHFGQSIPSSAIKAFQQVSKIGGKDSPLRNLANALGKEQDLSKTLHYDALGALKIIEENHPDFKKAIDKAYGYAVFPAVGKATAVLGGTYGKGEVYEQNKLVGYAGIVQVTLGVQLGGDTVTQIVIFSDKEALKRFKNGKVSFAANASAVIVKAAAAVTNGYQSDRVYTFSEGGLLIEAAIGLQKYIFKPAALTRGKSIEDESGEEQAKAA